jgi:signal transduction histidine kinase
MQTLIDDLLRLAREGETDVERDAIDLAAVVESCWQTVETADADLRIETDAVVRADESRIKQLLENLVRNAIEHGGEDVTVTVGDLDDGFFVEDDGTGIPEAKRATLFEREPTRTDAGTRFGLSIVRQIVESHDWYVDVTEGAAGGARFEFTGVEFEP